jgi:thiamine biosynthesis lipoprotein
MTQRETHSPPLAEWREDAWAVGFTAMGCPCEVLVDTEDSERAIALADVAREEAPRIERAFSRYRDDNIVHRINSAGGRPVTVDAETAALIDYAAACHEMSGGGFDITTGALRRAWTFDGRDALRRMTAIASALARDGWHRVTWRTTR